MPPRQQIPATTAPVDASRTLASYTNTWQSSSGTEASGVALIHATSYQHTRCPPECLDAHTDLAPSEYSWTFPAALQPGVYDSSIESLTPDGSLDQIGPLEPISNITDAIINGFVVPHGLLRTTVPSNLDSELANGQSPIDEEIQSARIVSNVPQSVQLVTKPGSSGNGSVNPARVEKPRKGRKAIEPSFRACWRCKKYRKPVSY